MLHTTRSTWARPRWIPRSRTRHTHPSLYAKACLGSGAPLCPWKRHTRAARAHLGSHLHWCGRASVCVLASTSVCGRRRVYVILSLPALPRGFMRRRGSCRAALCHCRRQRDRRRSPPS